MAKSPHSRIFPDSSLLDIITAKMNSLELDTWSLCNAEEWEQDVPGVGYCYQLSCRQCMSKRISFGFSTYSMGQFVEEKFMRCKRGRTITQRKIQERRQLVKVDATGQIIDLIK